MNWDDPIQRALLIRRVGLVEYNKLLKAQQDASVVATVNGYAIRPVGSTHFGRLFAVDGTKRAFATREAAEEFARRQPAK